QAQAPRGPVAPTLTPTPPALTPTPPAQTVTLQPTTGSDGERVNVLVTFRARPGAAESAILTHLGATVRHSYQLIPTIAASIPRGALAALSASPGVLRVESDATIHAFDAELDASWGVKHI